MPYDDRLSPDGVSMGNLSIEMSTAVTSRPLRIAVRPPEIFGVSFLSHILEFKVGHPMDRDGTECGVHGPMYAAEGRKERCTVTTGRPTCRACNEHID